MRQIGADLGIRALGVAGDALQVLLHVGVVEDLEVVGGVDVPLEIVVLDPILAEVGVELGRGLGRRVDSPAEGQRTDQTGTDHAASNGAPARGATHDSPREWPAACGGSWQRMRLMLPVAAGWPQRGGRRRAGPSYAPPPPCVGRIVADPGAPDGRNRRSHAAPAGRQDGGGPSNRGAGRHAQSAWDAPGRRVVCAVIPARDLHVFLQESCPVAGPLRARESPPTAPTAAQPTRRESASRYRADSPPRPARRCLAARAPPAMRRRARRTPV